MSLASFNNRSTDWRISFIAISLVAIIGFSSTSEFALAGPVANPSKFQKFRDRLKRFGRDEVAKDQHTALQQAIQSRDQQGGAFFHFVQRQANPEAGATFFKGDDGSAGYAVKGGRIYKVAQLNEQGVKNAGSIYNVYEGLDGQLYELHNSTVAMRWATAATILIPLGVIGAQIINHSQSSEFRNLL